MKRPNYNFTDEELKQIAKDTYGSIPINFDECGINEDNIFKVIKYDYCSNGYEYAKELESLGAYNINSIIVEELDWISTLLDKLNEKHIMQWVKDNNIKPKFKIGKEVFYMDGLEKKKSIINYIDNIKAVYHIKLTENSSRIISFERIEKLNS